MTRVTVSHRLRFSPVVSVVEIDAPTSAEIIAVRERRLGMPRLTLLGDPDAPTEVRAFVRIADGDEVPEAARYVGSTVDYHVFELARPEVEADPLAEATALLVGAGYYTHDKRHPHVLARLETRKHEPLGTEEMQAVGTLREAGYTIP